MLKRLGFFAATVSMSALALSACGDRRETDSAALENGAGGTAEADDLNTLPDPDEAAPEVPGGAVPPVDAPPPAPYDPSQDYGEPGARADFEFAENGSGTAWFFETPEGVRVYALVRSMAPGAYATHIHETGDCSAPDFSSAGEHLGLDAGVALPDKPDDFEAGMLPDIAIADDGSGTLNAVLEVVTFSEDTERTWPLFDEDGAAIVIHRFASGELPPGEDNPPIACAEIFESDL